ncbi:MAG: hypothetical protein WCC84_12830 [Candidatus Cybelea sp.]
MAAALLQGCAGSQPPMGALPQSQTVAATAHGDRSGRWTLPKAQHKKIKHIVIIVQMDRSFNNLFLGYPGAKTQSYGYDSNNKKISLMPISLATKWDLQHNANAFYASCNGTGKIPGTDCRMNGFNRESCNPVAGKCPKSEYLAYAYVPNGQIKPYFDMSSMCWPTRCTLQTLTLAALSTSVHHRGARPRHRRWRLRCTGLWRWSTRLDQDDWWWAYSPLLQ